MIEEYDECAMGKAKYEKVKGKIKELLLGSFSKTKLCAYIHDMWQEYMISSNQEEELWVLADPDGEADETYMDYYWDEMEEENPLMAAIE